MVTRNPLFLQDGVDINAQDDEGETALMKAIDATELDQVEWLLTNGADVNIRDESGETALDRASQNLIFTLSDILKKARVSG